MPSYEITIPGRGKFRVTSETELSDQQAYEAALSQSATQETPASVGRAAGIAARGALPPTAMATAGALMGAPAGPVGSATGALVGGLAIPASDFLVNLYNLASRSDVQLPSSAISDFLNRLGLPQPESRGERMLEAGGGALAGVGTQLPAIQRLATAATSPVTRGVAEMAAQAPKTQIATAAPAAGTAQYVTEATGSPLAGLAAGTAVGMAPGVGRQPQTKFAEELKKEANQAYKLAEEAGLVVQPGYVKNIADRVSKVAFNDGYDPGLHPQISAVLKRLSDEGNTPKTLEELERLRRIVRAPGQTFDNPDQQRIAGNMIDEFDNLVESVGAQNINVTGSKDVALSALSRARDTYKKSRKVSIIEDMIENATTRASQQTQAGLDNTLRNQFVNLSTNKKRMASFTKAERDEITRIARGGGNLQQMLRFTGRFAIRGPVTGIFAGGAATYEPTIGIPLALAAEGGKRGAEALRQRDISRLMEQIAGRQVSQPSLLPPTALRGLLSSQYGLE